MAKPGLAMPRQVSSHSLRGREGSRAQPFRMDTGLRASARTAGTKRHARARRLFAGASQGFPAILKMFEDSPITTMWSSFWKQ